MTEEAKELDLIEMEKNDESVISAYNNIPYFLLDEELSPSMKNEYQNDFNQIAGLYTKYKLGCSFLTEASNGDYIPSKLRYKKSAMIINKEARFLFSNPPSFNINQEDVDTEFTDENAILQDFLDSVLDKTDFNGKLLKAGKDCFIGKRIAIVCNFNESSGITVTFLNSMEFIYETSGERDNELTKFVMFIKILDVSSLRDQRWLKKKYEKINDEVFLTEEIYSGTGELIEVLNSSFKIEFNYIPATVVLNDGLTGEWKGESELGLLIDYEKSYSRLSNSDIDSLRKNMHSIKYTIDASQGSTSKLSTSPGSYWDLQSDEEKSEVRQAQVGTLESEMKYSEPLKSTLERIENEMYNEVDVPNITSEQLAGVITSGKTIQALYWGLTVRCDEKMLAWGHSLRFIAETIIEGGKLYPNCIKNYIDVDYLPDIPYNVFVENNYPIPEDIKEEKELDIAEVDAKVMSKKSYLKKWRRLNDSEADEELNQIKIEQELLENSVLRYMGNGSTTSNEEVKSEDGDTFDVEDVKVEDDEE
ncbi:MAG: phage portal protein [Methanobrevibacter sp.]|nr:phage portal protein [Methanobrevibacter sp.]